MSSPLITVCCLIAIVSLITSVSLIVVFDVQSSSMIKVQQNTSGQLASNSDCSFTTFREWEFTEGTVTVWFYQPGMNSTSIPAVRMSLPAEEFCSTEEAGECCDNYLYRVMYFEVTEIRKGVYDVSYMSPNIVSSCEIEEKDLTNVKAWVPMLSLSVASFSFTLGWWTKSRATPTPFRAKGVSEDFEKTAQRLEIIDLNSEDT